MYTKFYDIRKTDAYKDAEGVYSILPYDSKYRIERLVRKEIYIALVFDYNVVRKIEDYCSKFFDCKEHGFSYELGCYFQKMEYQSRGFIESDIKRFSSLIAVYNSDRFPEEYKLLQELVKDLQWFLEKWDSYEENHPELFCRINN